VPESRKGAALRRFGREETAILWLLAGLAAAAWAVMIYESRAGSMGMGLTMGLEGPLFVAIWVVMMAAMMFPSAAPMILVFSRVTQSKRTRGQSFVPTWVFVGAYLTVWAAAGVVAFVVATNLQMLAMANMSLQSSGRRWSGLLFVAAGAYQFSPLKNACLSKCRSPLTFILTSWRDGYRGAVEMGVRHGLFCLGCCWLLFAILFPLGIMSVPAMAVIATLILAEKVFALGVVIARALGIALMAYGLLILIVPSTLPAPGT
jgi:predicted metal-binding membrane protein